MAASDDEFCRTQRGEEFPDHFAAGKTSDRGALCGGVVLAFGFWSMDFSWNLVTYVRADCMNGGGFGFLLGESNENEREF